MVSHGSLSVNRDCDTIPQLSNYSTKYFLHFSDDKFKTIPEILKMDIQFSHPEEVSVTFTCKRIFLPQPNTMQYIIPANLTCYVVHAISWTSRDNTRAVFSKTLPSSAKVLGSSIISIIMILTSTFHFNCNCFRMLFNYISVCL